MPLSLDLKSVELCIREQVNFPANVARKKGGSVKTLRAFPRVSTRLIRLVLTAQLSISYQKLLPFRPILG